MSAAAPSRTITDQLVIPHVLNSVTFGAQVAHHRLPFVLPPVPIPYRPPYITRVRRLLSMNLPVIITAISSAGGSFELNSLEAFAVDLYSNKLLLATLPFEVTSIQNPQTESIVFRWEGFCNANFQNPIDVTNTSTLELACKGVTSAFTTAQTSMTIGVDYNLQASGEGEFIAANGAFLYDEEDRNPAR